MEAAFSLGVYSRHATGRAGRLRPPPRRCPPGDSGGDGGKAAGLPGPHGPPAAGTEPCGQPGRRRQQRSLPSVPATLPRAAAAPPLCPLRRRLRAPQGTPRPSLPGGAAGLGWVLAAFGCLKRSGGQGKCRLTAGKTRGLADFVCKK